MSFAAVAKILDVPVHTLERESIMFFLEKKLMEIETELLSISHKYKAKSIREFEKVVRKGKISESTETRDDFFQMDHLEGKREKLRKLLRSLQA